MYLFIFSYTKKKLNVFLVQRYISLRDNFVKNLITSNIFNFNFLFLITVALFCDTIRQSKTGNAQEIIDQSQEDGFVFRKDFIRRNQVDIQFISFTTLSKFPKICSVIYIHQ